MKRIALALVAFATACAAPPAEDESLGSSTSNISMPACGTALNEIDGVWAYSNGWAEGTGESCNGWSADSTLLYQCVEFAQRYSQARFGTPLKWNVQYAAQMCNANPAGTTVHWAGSGYQPKHGDIIVWQGGTYGHVAVVKTASAGAITIVEQNGAWSANGTRDLSSSDGYRSAGCFISGNNAATTTTTGDDTKPAGETCRFGFGLYCGGNGISGETDTLYDCQPTGKTVVEKCAAGCRRMPDKYNDKCN